uniref:Uncharacterized protein n=1 Tax=Paramoeba aestuarina TaxID=180227 RepID=A0A6U3BM79_9EUKA|mmetsp:Transcript_3572/g.5383  ORF Transcript_3572/g.5383 Transcript_3572/m.5383 type:complete len:219 (+) Transcript_3572:90-746(+)|eukprot:CAMPEP_0201508740 /NCGR_PEP_ID=MMETSP0161_2-20130828/2006_1 /ASSEMBLY_ACC=CAM_ASM_000251 /TAXON_ID=180227 /ORGANISM="Neoparamoeba aestuarina, Strain SoJaBio B1-5/56/2" /LENGTH=218 /DNA_ID=CAMNT_0047903495 /DNA_START=132 /DNA_END=788 /DNA_ORIENTATION=-
MGGKESKQKDEGTKMKKKDLEKETQLKVVIVGDSSVGKTSLLIRIIDGTFPEEYIPTVLGHEDKDPYVYEMNNGAPINIHFWDTAGQKYFSRLRPLSYPGADVVLIAFSVANDYSYDNISCRWCKEVRHYLPDTPIILVGTQIDRRNDEKAIEWLNGRGKKITQKQEAEKLAKEIGCESYVETSARLGENIEGLLEEICYVVGDIPKTVGLTVKRAKK